MCIESDDLISRCIVYAKAFQSGIHVDAVLFVFQQTASDGATHESGILRRLAPEDADVHRRGCRLAAVQNQRFQAAPTAALKRYYCGFRTAKYDDLPTTTDVFSLEVKLVEENGDAAHVDFALTVFGSTRNERATARSEAGLAIAEAFGEPTEHICTEDTDDAEHPLYRDPQCLRRAFPEYPPSALPIIGR